MAPIKKSGSNAAYAGGRDRQAAVTTTIEVATTRKRANGAAIM